MLRSGNLPPEGTINRPDLTVIGAKHMKRMFSGGRRPRQGKAAHWRLSIETISKLESIERAFPEVSEWCLERKK
jgi:hypothetical protein